MDTTSKDKQTRDLTRLDVDKAFGTNAFSEYFAFRLEYRSEDDKGPVFVLTGTKPLGAREDIVRIRSKKRLSILTGILY